MTTRTLPLALLLAAHSAVFAQLNALPTEADLKARGLAPVAGEQLKALLSNQTLYHTNLGSGQQYTIYYRDDGRRFMKTGAGVRSTKWWIKDDTRCEDSFGKGQLCYRFYPEADLYVACQMGADNCAWQMKALAGDVDGLAR